MTRFTTRFTVAIVAALSLATSALAVDVRGVVRGTVADKSGGVLPGATVTINSPSLIQKNLTATTNERGEYRFPLLDPGLYEVKVEMSGFAPATAKGIRLMVGQTTEVPFALDLAAAGEVTIEASPTVDTESTRVGVNFTKEMLQSIPSPRTVNGFLNFTPGATDGTVHGSSVRGNNLQLDGVSVTDPTVGTQLVTFNIDTIEEVQIGTGGHQAEYGQVAGSVINAVTKSGGNAFSGEGNVYFQNQDLTADNGEQYLKRLPTLTPNKVRRKIDTQAQLGGPVRKDHIWFYGSYNFIDADTDVVGFPQTTNENQNLGFGKVTWQITPKNKLIASNTYDSRDRDFRGAGALTPPEATRKQTGHGNTPSFEFNSILNSTTYLTLRGAFVDSGFDLIPQNEKPAHLNIDTGVLEVSDGRIDINKRKRKTVQASLSHYRDDMAGSHDFKFGFEYENSDEYRDFTAQQGLFYYDTGTTVSTPTYVYTVQDPPETAAQKRFSFYAQDTWTIGDRLTLNPGVRIDRNRAFFETQEGPNGETFDETDAFTTTDVSPRFGLSYDITGDGKSAFRFAYSRLLDGSITQYFSSINQNAISGQLRVVCGGPADGGFCAPGQKFSDPIGEFGASNTTIDPDFALPITDEFSVGIEREVMPNLSFQVNYIDKKETRLAEDVNLRDSIPRQAIVPGDTLVDSEDGSVKEVIPASKPITIWEPDLNDSDEFVISNPDGAEREYRSLEFVMTKRMSNKWQFLGSFVISRSAGLVGTDFNGSNSISGLFNSPNALINGYGNLNFHRPYQLKMQGSYQGPWGINVGGFYRMFSGTPFTRTARITRKVSGCAGGAADCAVLGGAITINAEPLGSRRLPRQHEMDFRLEKQFNLPFGRADFIVDLFNLFNIDTVTAVRNRTAGANKFGDPTGYHTPREIRVASRFVW